MDYQPMSIEMMIEHAGRYNGYVLIYLIAIPCLAFLYGKIHKKDLGGRSPHRYVYSVLIYLSAIPGMMGCVLTGYSLFFINANLLQVSNPVLYFLPIVSMVISFVLIRGNVNLDEVPGFDRLYGLLVVLGVTFVLALSIVKTRIWLFFGGSIPALIGIVIFLFLLLQWGGRVMTGSTKEGEEKPPRFPDVK